MERNDARRSGQPTTAAAVTQQLLQRADELIRNDQRFTIRKYATELSVSTERVSNFTDVLGYSKVCLCRVPRSPTDYRKTVRKEVCSDLLSRYEADG